jgi:phage shock protein PspC (stress-responsive transcriptional regulator)
MKRTFTINLNSTVYHIDNDAYELLKQYLHDVEERLSPEERKEVMTDIESRIAELFSEKLQKGKGVINIDDVEEIIKILGKPNQYEDEDYSSTEEPSSKQKSKRRRKYYRDRDNAALGGVASGLAIYLGWEVVPIRLILVLLLFLGWGTLIPIYLVIWLLVPEAKTIAQKLEMQGEEVTAERIKEEVQNVKSYVESEQFKESATSIGQKLGKIFMFLIKIAFGFIAVIMAFVGFILLGTLMLVLSVMVFEPTMIMGFLPEWGLISPQRTGLMILSLLLVIGIPIFMLIYWAVRTIRNKQGKSGALPWVMLVLWFVGVFMAIGLGAKSFFRWSQHDFQIPGVFWSDDDYFVDEVRTVASFQSVKSSGALKILLTPDTAQSVVVHGNPSALSYLVSEVDKDGVLNLYMEKFDLNFDRDHPMRVSINTNQIKTIDLSGASSLKTTKKFQTETMKVSLSGASWANLNLAVSQHLKLDLNGASKAEIKGHSYQLEADVSAASKLDAQEFMVKNADIHASGASSVEANVSDSLKLYLSGASKFKSEQTPLHLHKDVSGGSSVKIR